MFLPADFIPNKPALEALTALIACGVQLGKVSKEYQLLGHRQARNTVCPGEEFYNWVQKMPGWTYNPVPVFTNATITIPHSSIAINGLQDQELPKDDRSAWFKTWEIFGAIQDSISNEFNMYFCCQLIYDWWFLKYLFWSIQWLHFIHTLNY